MQTKFQRVKNSATKLARVLVVDESPSNQHDQSTVQQTCHGKTRDTTLLHSMSESQDALTNTEQDYKK